MVIAHAKLSASSSSRWLLCPGSVRLSSSYPNRTSAAAEEGTCAHELGEICLSTGNAPESYIGKNLKDAPKITVDAEMAEYINGYVDYIRALGGELMIEQRVSFSDYVPEGFGTSDTIIINDSHVDIVDLKYGRGISVDAEDNSQLKLYALGVLQEYGFIYDIESFTLHIYQPRTNNISSWSITTDDLLTWGEFVTRRANEALSGNGELAAGDKQCQWCAHKPNCQELLRVTQDVIKNDFANYQELPVVDEVNPADILPYKSLIEAWLKSVELKAFEDMSQGKTITGFKLVEGRGTRRWGDESQTIALLQNQLGDNLYTHKLISPTQAEKLIGKDDFKEFAQLVIKPRGKTSIAKESDKRKSIIELNNELTKNDF